MEIEFTSLSMTQLIETDDFKFGELSARLSFMKKLLNKPSLKHVGKYNEYDLYHTGSDGSSSYYFLTDGSFSELYYVCKYVTRKVIGDKALSQVIVYRNPEVWTGTRGIVQFVMEKILLPRFGIIMSDIQQTLDGRRLWVATMQKALSKSLYVYQYDRLLRALKRVRNSRALDDAVRAAYSRDIRSRHSVFIISTVQLEAKKE